MKKYILFLLAWLPLACLAAIPDVTLYIDVTSPNPQKFAFSVRAGNTPVVVVRCVTNLTTGGAYTGFSTGWTPQLNYFLNDSASSGKTISGTLAPSTGVITFTAVTNSFPAQGVYFCEVYLQNGTTPKLTIGQGQLTVTRSPSSGSFGALNLSPIINWDIIVNRGTVPWAALTEPIFLGSVAYQITAAMTNTWITDSADEELLRTQFNSTSGQVAAALGTLTTNLAATISIAWTSNGLAGSSAFVTNTGDSNAASFGFIIPVGSNGQDGAQGAQGTQGIQGIQGPAGTNGTNGTNGSNGTNGVNGTNGAAATISVAYTSNGVAGSAAIVTNTGSSSAASFGFVIPVGSNGATGATGPAGTNGINTTNQDWSAITNRPGFLVTNANWIDTGITGSPIAVIGFGNDGKPTDYDPGQWVAGWSGYNATQQIVWAEGGADTNLVSDNVSSPNVSGLWVRTTDEAGYRRWLNTNGFYVYFYSNSYYVATNGSGVPTGPAWGKAIYPLSAYGAYDPFQNSSNALTPSEVVVTNTVVWNAGWNGTNWNVTRDGVLQFDATNVLAKNGIGSNLTGITAHQVGAVATNGDAVGLTNFPISVVLTNNLKLLAAITNVIINNVTGTVANAIANVTIPIGVTSHTNLVDQNGDTNFLHITAAEKIVATNILSVTDGTNTTIRAIGANSFAVDMAIGTNGIMFAAATKLMMTTNNTLGIWYFIAGAWSNAFEVTK